MQNIESNICAIGIPEGKEELGRRNTKVKSLQTPVKGVLHSDVQILGVVFTDCVTLSKSHIFSDLLFPSSIKLNQYC